MELMKNGTKTGESQQNIAGKKLKSENKLCQMYSEGPKSSNRQIQNRKKVVNRWSS